MDIKGKKILIARGSSGIGLATAGELIRKGAKVFIVGRQAPLRSRLLKAWNSGNYRWFAAETCAWP